MASSQPFPFARFLLSLLSVAAVLWSSSQFCSASELDRCLNACVRSLRGEVTTNHLIACSKICRENANAAKAAESLDFNALLKKQGDLKLSTKGKTIRRARRREDLPDKPPESPQSSPSPSPPSPSPSPSLSSDSPSTDGSAANDKIADRKRSPVDVRKGEIHKTTLKERLEKKKAEALRAASLSSSNTSESEGKETKTDAVKGEEGETTGDSKASRSKGADKSSDDGALPKKEQKQNREKETDETFRWSGLFPSAFEESQKERWQSLFLEKKRADGSLKGCVGATGVSCDAASSPSTAASPTSIPTFSASTASTVSVASDQNGSTSLFLGSFRRVGVDEEALKRGWLLLHFDFANISEFVELFSSKVPSESLDVIYASHVLQFFPLLTSMDTVEKPIALDVLGLFFRALKPGGRLYLSVPDFQKLAWLQVNPSLSLSVRWQIQQELMGGMDEWFSRGSPHLSVWDEEVLTLLLSEGGFAMTARVSELGAGFEDWSTRKIAGENVSLNVVAQKEAREL